MKEIRFTWNKTKAKANLLKHKISFNEATSVFSDDNARLIYDPDHSLEEERFLLLGLSYKLKISIVVHCMKDESNEIRIISARKASQKEQKQYGGYIL
ncbi:MAG: BrnT family toxin [Deltaproteobacteria bacterium]|uniref:BrnT family toxin n=1 Tax=Desulfobacula sp. TaxID=2593537 RepID=UPI0019ACDDE9|nr:BrnT family toxin [Candidatus Desulfobacula maris]MBL6993219.1 BrnT family toxin [Desulfobacula sp.]